MLIYLTNFISREITAKTPIKRILRDFWSNDCKNNSVNLSVYVELSNLNTPQRSLKRRNYP